MTGVLPFSSLPDDERVRIAALDRRAGGRRRLLNACQRLKSSITRPLDDLRPLPVLEARGRTGRPRGSAAARTPCGISVAWQRYSVAPSPSVSAGFRGRGHQRLGTYASSSAVGGSGAGRAPFSTRSSHASFQNMRQPGLAAVVSRPVAPDPLEVDGVVHPAHDPGAGARRVGALCDGHRAAAVLEHLGHERKAVERSVARPAWRRSPTRCEPGPIRRA